MDRRDFAMYTSAFIGSLEIHNRFVRSATADLGPWKLGRYSEEDFALYRELARSGIGLIIVGGSEVLPAAACEMGTLSDWTYSHEVVRVEGTTELLETMRAESPDCRIVAQLECNALISGERPAGPSAVTSPYFKERFRELAVDEIERIIDAFVETIVRMKDEGFDGVQLHAAHGGGLWHFLSPAGNQRTDEYGGTEANRVRIVAEIVSGARKQVGEFPIFIKANCTDYLDGGIDKNSFPELARELERAGLDAIEVSGGTWDALVRSEEELGFRPVPAAESHTNILSQEKQNYFQPFVEDLHLGIPIILVGGIRNANAAEAVIQSGAAEFVAMCRPLIREPALIERWLKGEGSAEAACIACNSCIYSMYLPFEKMGRKTVTCLPSHNISLYAEAQDWLNTFVEEIRVD